MPKIDNVLAYLDALHAFDTAHPNACHHCNATGLITYFEDPGARDCSLSGALMEFEDVCPHCEGADIPICAVCGQPLIETLDQENYPNGRSCGCDNVKRPVPETYFDPDEM